MLHRNHIEKARDLDRQLRRLETALKMIRENDPELLRLKLEVHKTHTEHRLEFGIDVDAAEKFLEAEQTFVIQQLERIGVRVDEAGTTVS